MRLRDGEGAKTGSGVLSSGVGCEDEEEVEESDGTSEGGSRDIGTEVGVILVGGSLKTYSVAVEGAAPDFRPAVAGGPFVATAFRDFIVGPLVEAGEGFCGTLGSADEGVGVAVATLALLRVFMWNASLGSRAERLLEVVEAMSLEQMISNWSNQRCRGCKKDRR